MDKTDIILVILAVLGLIIECFALVLSYFQWANITPTSIAFLQPYTLGAIIVLFTIGTPILLIAIIVFIRKVFSKKQVVEPSYKHLEAWFFYNKKFSWDKGERDPHNHVPRQKVVLVKDLKKAYLVGNYALNLALNDKLNWFTYDEQQDLDGWCLSKGYTLTNDEGTKEKIVDAPFFEAEIKGKKEYYRRGESVRFRTHYRGYIKKGFFDNKIVNVEGKKFFHKAFWRMYDRVWSWPVETLSLHAKWRWWFTAWIPSLQGKLNGYVDETYEWSWGIPDVPLGKYRIYMRVYSGLLFGIIVEEKEDTINIIE